MIDINIEKKLNTYNGLQVLKVKKHFDTGSITKIYGPSGAGKTTFLKIIAGFIHPEKGYVRAVNTEWINTDKKINISPQVRKVGFVFQDYALFPNMTVRQHLAYATKDAAWIDRLLTLGKLETISHHKPLYLSGGQQQRLAILRALAAKPQLLLMDEPFSALDQAVKITLIAELKALFEELKLTVMIVSHNAEELSNLASDELEINTV